MAWGPSDFQVVVDGAVHVQLLFGGLGQIQMDIVWAIVPGEQALSWVSAASLAPASSASKAMKISGPDHVGFAPTEW